MVKSTNQAIKVPMALIKMMDFNEFKTLISPEVTKQSPRSVTTVLEILKALRPLPEYSLEHPLNIIQEVKEALANIPRTTRRAKFTFGVDYVENLNVRSYVIKSGLVKVILYPKIPKFHDEDFALFMRASIGKK
jgi:hypothetical protein